MDKGARHGQDAQRVWRGKKGGAQSGQEVCDVDKSAWHGQDAQCGQGVCVVKEKGAQSGEEVCDVDKGAQHGQDAQCGQGVRVVKERGAQSGQRCTTWTRTRVYFLRARMTRM